MHKLGFAVCVALFGATGLVAQAAPADDDGGVPPVLTAEEQAMEDARDRFGALRLDPVEARVGVVGRIEFDGPTVSIDGLRFDFAPDAVVTFQSGYGAPTLLTPGMAVRIVYESAPDDRRAGTILMLDEISMDPELLH